VIDHRKSARKIPLDFIRVERGCTAAGDETSDDVELFLLARRSYWRFAGAFFRKTQKPDCVIFLLGFECHGFVCAMIIKEYRIIVPLSLEEVIFPSLSLSLCALFLCTALI
jgi:hypothetical protein